MEGTFSYAPPDKARAALAAKLSAVAEAVGHQALDGTNAKLGYAYTSYAAFAAALRPALRAAGVGLTVSTARVESRDWQGERSMITQTDLVVELSFIDLETGAMLVISAPGTGRDTGDKGAWKALTGAVKYGLLRTFLASDHADHDPDADADAPAPAPHWTKDPESQRAFAAWLEQEEINPAAALHALGVRDLRDYRGSKHGAKMLIETKAKKEAT